MMLFWLISAHFLCDYPLQGNYLSMAKNRHEVKEIPFDPSWGVEDKYETYTERKWKEWFWALSGHGIIHGAAVALITGIWWLGALEAILHAVIDDAKCAGKLNYNQDQVLHISCKVIWALLAFILTKGW